MSQSNNTHLERVKEAIHNSPKLSDKEKSASVKTVEEWAVEDKAMALLSEQLLEISAEIRPLLAELGLI